MGTETPERAAPITYQQVREILERAAGSSPSDYEGLGRFWELPRDRLLELRLCGVRLIAPEKAADSSCCHQSARSERSGLIQGLRGQSPFDGSRCPRLPWGGDAVAPEDIRLIADWIDSGCPEGVESHPLEGTTEGPEMVTFEAPVVGETFDPYPGSANEYKYQRGELKQRMNIDCLDAGQLEKLRYAFRRLYDLNRWPEDSRNYNNLALIHQNHCQHGWERFLPWHRIYMYEFEQALQDVCPDVTMPYWDWTMPHYCPEHPERGWIIPKSLQAFITDASIEFLLHADPPLPPEQAEQIRPLVGRHFPSQRRFFDAVARATGIDYNAPDADPPVKEQRNRFIDALLASNALWYPLRYPAEYQKDGSPSTINVAIQYHYPTAGDICQILSLNNFRDFGGGSMYNDSFGFLDQNPHNTMHIWTGGQNPDASSSTDYGADLDYDRNRGVQVAGRQFHSSTDLYSQPALGDMFSNLTASYDPIFWPVHSNVDRLWWEWQQAHPHSQPADLDSVLTPWSYTIGDTLDMYRFGYEYVKCSYIVPVGMEAPVGRFVSRPIDLSELVKGSAFRQAEVRLHRVPQLPRSCFVRVFLNLPDANASTPIDHPNYAGYLAIFGHGPCYGGPGHCDVPPASRRRFDHRPRSHNTPRNHRIDVTACARRLLAGPEPASSLEITLVVIGVDYREEDELLRLEGVSLNFFD